MRSLGVAALVGALLTAATLTGSAAAEAAPSVGPLVATPLTVATGASGGSAAGKSLNIPAGWKAEVWANVPGARMAAWSPDGKLLVSTGSGGSVKILTPTSAGKAPTVKTLISGLPGVQGIAFAKSGTVLVLGAIPSHNPDILREQRGASGLARALSRTQSIAPGDYSLGVRMTMWRDTLRAIRAQVEAAGYAGMIEVEIFSTARWAGDQRAYLQEIKAAYLAYV